MTPITAPTTPPTRGAIPGCRADEEIVAIDLDERLIGADSTADEMVDDTEGVSYGVDDESSWAIDSVDGLSFSEVGWLSVALP